MNDLFAFLTQLMTQHAAMFQTMGTNMFRGFAVILIVWFGVKSALASASGGDGALFHFENFADLLITIGFGFGMITYYTTPIPGFGVSFYHLIIDQGLNLANQLNHSLVQDLWDRLTGLYWGMETPALTLALNILEIIRYAVTVLCILAAQAAVFAVIAFGYGRSSHRGPSGANIYSVFYRAKDGVAFLGLAQSAYPVRLLSRDCQRLSVRVRQPANTFRGLAPAPIRRGHDPRAFLSAGASLGRFYVWGNQDSRAGEFAIHRTLGRVRVSLPIRVQRHVSYSSQSSPAEGLRGGPSPVRGALRLYSSHEHVPKDRSIVYLWSLFGDGCPFRKGI
jgi:hypothetical protein